MSSDANPFRYSGEYFDAESGDYYLRARYYNPRLGRFLTEDPVRDGNNWYVYCNNNPVKYVDPSGNDAIVLNKYVDNPGRYFGVEHTSAFFQDENDDWWFYFWGDSVEYVKVDDPNIFESVDAINDWLSNYFVNNPEYMFDSNEPKTRPLLDEKHPYHDFVYIVGDFTEACAKAKENRNNYLENIEKVLSGAMDRGDFGVLNSYYSLLSNNCSQNTMKLLYTGILPGGITVEEYMKMNEYGISPLPNVNITNLQRTFYNTATTRTGFSSAVSELRSKYEGKSKFIQWLYTSVRNNLGYIA